MPTGSSPIRLSWLSWYQPGIFTAVMDYMEFSDNLAADTEQVVPQTLWTAGPLCSRLGEGSHLLLCSNCHIYVSGTRGRMQTTVIEQADKCRSPS